MKKQNKNQKLSPRSMLYAFESLALEASERELDNALSAAGENPDALLASANAAIDRALAAVSKSSISSTDKVDKLPTSSDSVILHKGLRAIVWLLRRKNGLSKQELADAAQVDVEEIRRIEFDENFTPSPRTIYQLEQFFGLKPRTLVLMSGAVSTHSSEFTDGVLKFAAHSKEMGGLTREEKKLLNDFVRFLSEELKKRG